MTRENVTQYRDTFGYQAWDTYTEQVRTLRAEMYDNMQSKLKRKRKHTQGSFECDRPPRGSGSTSEVYYIGNKEGSGYETRPPSPYSPASQPPIEKCRPYHQSLDDLARKYGPADDDEVK